MSKNPSSWFTDNLSIAGFSADLAAFTTCRELIENAVDASRASALKKIRIKLSEVEPNILEVAVLDWGKGMSSETVDSFTCLFESTAGSSHRPTTSNAEIQAVGRFGVGLKLAAINSEISTGRALRVTSGGVSFSLHADRVEIIFPTEHFPENPVTCVTAYAEISGNFRSQFNEYFYEIKRNLGDYDLDIVGLTSAVSDEGVIIGTVTAELNGAEFRVSA